MLQIRNLRRVFNPGSLNEVVALDGVDLHIEEGSFVVVIGSNGSGKSTLLNAVAGAFEPDAGTIHVAGQDITRWPEHRRAALIGRVFQNPYSGTAPTMTVAENLALAHRRGQSRGLGWALPGARRAALREELKRLGLGLESRLDAEIGTLSGGQRQAITLLMATSANPRLLLLDEHTAALDPRSAEQIIELTDQTVRQMRLTTLMVTHSMQQAVTFGDRLIMMYRGRIRLDIAGDQKRALQIPDLLAEFDRLRREEHLPHGSTDLIDMASL